MNELVEITQPGRMIVEIRKILSVIETKQSVENDEAIAFFIRRYRKSFFYRLMVCGLKHAFFLDDRAWTNPAELASEMLKKSDMFGDWKSSHQRRRQKKLNDIIRILAVANEQDGQVFLTGNQVKAIRIDEEVIE